MKSCGILLAGALFAGPSLDLKGEETNTLELIQKLQRRIDELENKVKRLENTEKLSTNTNQASSPQRIESLDQQVKTLQTQQEFDRQTGRARVNDASTLSLGTGGIIFSSADDNFKFKVRGYIQADARFYPDDSRQASTDTFLLNRVRPVFEGTIFKDFDYKMMPDFGQGKAVIQDAFLDAHFLPWLSLRAGKYKGPVGLERLESARDLIFVERALTVDLVPNRDIGFALHGEFLKGILGYEAGVFNGAVDGSSDDADENDSKDVQARVFAYPFKLSGVAPLQGLGLGIAGTTGHENGTAPSYKTIGQQTFFTFNTGVTANGSRDRIAPQGFYYWGPFGLLAEYVISAQDVNSGALHKRLANSAWQAAVSYVVTGEKASYFGVAPTHPFSPAQGHWGALEFAARVSELHIDSDAFRNFGTPLDPVYLADHTKSASDALAWGVGVNWYLNSGVKLMLDFEHTRFEDGATRGNRPDENAVLSRLQVAF